MKCFHSKHQIHLSMMTSSVYSVTVIKMVAYIKLSKLQQNSTISNVCRYFEHCIIVRSHYGSHWITVISCIWRCLCRNSSRHKFWEVISYIMAHSASLLSVNLFHEWIFVVSFVGNL